MKAEDFSYIGNADAAYIDSLYKKYLEDPSTIEEGWRRFFEGFEFAGTGNGTVKSHEHISKKEIKVQAIIHGFRDRGHLLSTTNPIRTRRDRRPYLDLADYDLEVSDLDLTFESGNEIGLESAKLEEIIGRLQEIYCGNIGFEYTHIEERERRMWLREKIEKRSLKPGYDLRLDVKERILKRLNDAVVFERFLHTKYIGQKRFSLEGGETTIPALDAIINKGAHMGVKEFVIGMAHRGRLNVLANILGKTYEQIFSEFEGTALPDLSFGDGDVKYHLGFSSQIETMTGEKVHLKLVPNPSHLESVDPVVEGFSRAKLDILYGENTSKVLPILIHGDAAIAGQGVVYETAQMSQLDGYTTGGTVHFVINNQIGFTTDFDDARTSTYCTAAANMIDAPVFHVNGDDPEAVVFASKLAIEYRQKFQGDVFIDMVCYRKHGHNEGDDPKFTQPEMYGFISKHPNPREVYSDILSKRGDVEADLANKLEKQFWGNLQERLDLVKQNPLPYEYQEPEQQWRSLKRNPSPDDFKSSPVTGIKKSDAEAISNHLIELPDEFNKSSKLHRLIKHKKSLLDQNLLDWAMAEQLAYGSLMMEGFDVRMSGQDVIRGTFSHRHAIFRDHKEYHSYSPLNTLKDRKGKFRIYNSLLSEFGVLGFEYGYSLASPNTLVLWEAQFGDFYNGAQVIVDQYVMAAESKWRRMSGLVMLLPHGYEGQGPEHSSARLERFLQSAAEFNVTIANCTTPANFFHLLRRQLIRPFRKPLIVMSPKSLLRHPKCVSPISNFQSRTRFTEVYDDSTFTAKTAKSVRRVLFCSGKVYYDLMDQKDKGGHSDVAIIRIEQLYPFPKDQVENLMDKYKGAEFFWVQEEPENMGAWIFIKNKLSHLDLKVVSRKESASPATGYKKVFDQRHEELLSKAFEI